MKFLLIFLVSLVGAAADKNKKFDDTEHRCPETQRVWYLKTYIIANDNRRRYVVNCGDLQFKNKIKGVKCELRKPLKCDGSNEGCNDNEWIGGFRATDVGLPVKMIQLFCCKAENFKTVECSTSSVLSVPGGDGQLTVDADQYLSLSTCNIINGKDNKINETQLTMSKCTYTVEEQGKTVKSVQSDSPKEGDSTKPTDDTPTPIVNIDGPDKASTTVSATTEAKKSIVATTTEATKTGTGLCCPNDWLVYDGNCHYIVRRAKSFKEAQLYCKAHDAELFSPQSESELKDVVSHAVIGQVNWIGLKANDAGAPKWISNSSIAIDSLNWLIKAPGNHGSSPPGITCAGSLASGDPRDFYLHFYDCNVPHNFICTKKRSTNKRLH